MISGIDKEDIDVSTLLETIEELEPSTDRSIPPATNIRRLANRVQQDEKVDEPIIEGVVEVVPEFLKHDRSSVHRLAAAASVVLVDNEPAAADRLLDQLLPMLEDDAFERRVMETIEYMSTVGPVAVGKHAPALIDRLDHSRDAVSRHAARSLLSLAEETPETVLEHLPQILATLTASFEPLSSEPTTAAGNNIQSLERNRRLEHVAGRLIVARAVAEVARSRPEMTADAVVESGSAEAVASLLDDDQARVRAAAAGIAALVAEQEPEPFEGTMPTLLDLLEDEYEVVRGSAIWTLRAIDDSRAIEGLQRASRDDPSAELQALAADGLAESDITDQN